MTQRLLPYGRMVEDMPMTGHFSIDADTTTGLTFGWNHGLYNKNGSVVTIAAGTVALTDNDTNYISISNVTDTIVADTTAPAGGPALYKITTASGVITAVVDYRLSVIATQE